MNTVAPLTKFQRFATDDLEFMRGAMTAAYCRHGIRTSERQPRIAALHNQADLGALSFNYLTYGVRLTVDVPEMPDFFLIDFPIAGSLNYQIRSRSFSCALGQCSITSPGSYLRSEWLRETQLITLKIDRGAVERVLAQMLERAITKPICFDPVLDCTQGTGASFRALVDFLIAELDQIDAVRHAPLWSRQLQRTVISGLLTTQRHTYSQDMAAHNSTASPRCVRRAEAFIRENLANTISIEDIVAVTGVPERTLFATYKKFRGMTPMTHHRSLRLQAARVDLLAARAQDTVASVACKWGFFHLGHFSRDYAARFGEKPSVTLQLNR
ncbi:MAG: AraC family transcriptional regulator [Steroidobacteraceae bacterium]